MSSRQSKTARPEVREIISLAERTDGWRVEQRLKHVDLHGPGGIVVSIAMAADDRDLRTAVNKLRRANFYGDTESAVSEVVDRPLIGKSFDQMSVDERAMYVWTIARDYAIKQGCTEQVSEGALYYLVRDHSIVDFIRLAFPDVTEYQSGKRPSDTGMRPIYDYLRAHALVVRKGQQALPMEGNGICISDSSNPNKVKSEHRSSKAAEKKTSVSRQRRNGPVTTRKVEPEIKPGDFVRRLTGSAPYVVKKVDDGTVIMVNLTNGAGAHVLLSEVKPLDYTFERPQVGDLLRKPTSKTVHEVRGVDEIVVTTRILTSPGNHATAAADYIYMDNWRKYVTIDATELARLQEQNTPAPEIVKPMTDEMIEERQDNTNIAQWRTGSTSRDPETPVLVPKSPPTATAVDDLLAGIEMLSESAKSIAQAQSGPDPVVEAQLAELRRDLAYERAQVAHQRTRAEHAEELLHKLRDIIENNVPKDAYPEIVKLVPPFPESGLTVVS